jgi:hypothetical protein
MVLIKFTIFIQKNEDMRRFGNKNKQTYFVLLSTCTIFAAGFVVLLQ